MLSPPPSVLEGEKGEVGAVPSIFVERKTTRGGCLSRRVHRGKGGFSLNPLLGLNA